LMLMSANTGVVTAQSGLERVRNQPVPIHYDMCSSARWPGSSGSWCSTASMPPAITSPAS
jgi:hypothetical protein